MTMKPIKTLSFAATATIATVSMAWTEGSMAWTDGADTPQEFGAVRWGRELEPALVRASTSHKPIMLLFQEVPG